MNICKVRIIIAIDRNIKSVITLNRVDDIRNCDVIESIYVSTFLIFEVVRSGKKRRNSTA